jgi:hypothetical protein
MRLCKIPDLEYKVFEKIRDTLYANIPFAMIHIGYSPALKVGIFNFWDSDYIPDEMKSFIMQPPLSRENKEKMTRELAELFKK